MSDEQRELDVEGEQHREDRDDHHDVRHEHRYEHHELVDLAQVEVRPRHQVPDLRAVVVPEVQLLQVREQLGSQHVLGAVSAVERAVPTQPRAQRRGQPEHEDHPAPLGDHRAVVGREAVVDRGARRERHEDLGADPEERHCEPERDPPPGALGGAVTTMRRPPRRSSGE